MQLGVHAVHLSCVISRLFHWFHYRFCFDLTEKKKKKKKKNTAPHFLTDTLIVNLKVVNGANFDITKITEAALLFQTDFPRLLFW